MATDNYNAHKWEVGDIIDGTFYYSAAIPRFYIVSRKSEKCVWLISLGKVSYARDCYGQEGQCMPNLAERGREKLHRITKGGYVRIDSYTTGKKWDGQPVEYYGD